MPGRGVKRPIVSADEGSLALPLGVTINVQLRAACTHGDLKLLKNLWGNGLPTDAVWDSDETLMFIAANHGHLRVVKWLFDLHHLVADHRSTNRHGCTPLSAACARGHHGVAKFLLSVSDHEVTYNHIGCTPLWKACVSGHLRVARLVARYLVLSDDDFTDMYDDRTLFMTVCRNGDIPVLGWLTHHGPRDQACISSSDGEHPMLFACGFSLDLVRWLHASTKARRDLTRPNNIGTTPFAHACAKGKLDVAEWLLRNGASGDMEEPDVFGRTPLHLVCELGLLETARWLINQRARIDTCCKCGDTPLYDASSHGFLDVVRLLLVHGADISSSNSDGDTALHVSCDNGYGDVAALLLARGANPLTRNKAGATPASAALLAGHLTLLKSNPALWPGVNAHARWGGHRATIFASVCSKGFLEVAKWLVASAGAKACLLRTPDSHGCTPMFNACAGGHLGVARWLYASGAAADVSTENVSGNTPYMAASLGSHFTVFQWLIFNGAACDVTGQMTPESLRYSRCKGYALTGEDCPVTMAISAALTQQAVFTRLVLPLTLSELGQLNPAINPPLYYWGRLRGCNHILKLLADFCGVIRGRELRNARAAARLIWGGQVPPVGYWA